MTTLSQKSFLELAVIWREEYMFELSVIAANRNFYGRTQVYDAPDCLLTFAKSFSDCSLNNVNLFYESGEPNGVSYFSMKYYSIGFTGHVGVEINLESNVATEYRQEEKDKLKLEIIVEPNQIDIFQKELFQLTATESGKATLYGRDRFTIE